jgi:glutamyl-tRNA reductase
MGFPMNTVVMVGVCHRVAPLALLERVAIPPSRRGDVLAAVRAAGFEEAVLLTTCSRTEIYAVGRFSPDRLVEVLAAQAGSAAHAIRRVAEVRVGDEVASHLFRVAAGLRSRVIGEPEIRSQVRAAFRAAYADRATGGVLGELFSTAVRLSGRIHSETELGSTTRSLARRAVDLALAGTNRTTPNVLVVGSGRMASATVSHLRRMGHRPTVVARDETRAIQLAGVTHARRLSDLTDLMHTAHVVICATSAREPLLGLDEVRFATSGRTGLLTLVDLSVPRNVDPDVADLDGVRVIDLEQMHGPSVDATILESVARAETMVRAAVRRHRDHLAARRAGPVIAAIRDRIEARCQEAVVSTAPANSAPEQLAAVARALAGRLAHPVTMTVRAASATGDDATILAVCEALDVTLTPEMVGLGVGALLTQGS